MQICKILNACSWNIGILIIKNAAPKEFYRKSRALYREQNIKYILAYLRHLLKNNFRTFLKALYVVYD